MQVCCGEQGLLASASKGTLFIDCSTIDVSSSRQVHQQASQLGIFSLRRACFWGSGWSSSRNFNLYGWWDKRGSGGRSFYLIMHGKNIIATGTAGSGQAAKMCNNMILGISMVGISEAFVLAEQLGLSAEKII